jgi:hypothetical protein
MKRDSALLFLLIAVFSVFNFLLSGLISTKMKRKAKDFLPDPALTLKQAFFLCLILAIALQ